VKRVFCVGQWCGLWVSFKFELGAWAPRGVCTVVQVAGMKSKRLTQRKEIMERRKSTISHIRVQQETTSWVPD